MPLKSTPLTQAAIRQMIKEIVNATIIAERARYVNARNDARGFGLVRGQDATPAVHECTFAGFMRTVGAVREKWVGGTYSYSEEEGYGM
ncbi:hypothetical protein Tco_0509756 [Tanacetum coccineum]